jgi:hypothetical protein
MLNTTLNTKVITGINTTAFQSISILLEQSHIRFVDIHKDNKKGYRFFAVGVPTNSLRGI